MLGVGVCGTFVVLTNVTNCDKGEGRVKKIINIFVAYK